MPARRDRSTALRQEGAVTWVTWAMLLGLAAAGYLAVMWVPVYVVHYEVKQVVRDYGNQAVKNRDDAELLKNMIEKIRTLDQETVEGPDGRPAKRPAVDLRAQDVTWERSADPPVLHVAFQYEREVRYPLLEGRSTVRVLDVDLNMDIARPDWGPAR